MKYIFIILILLSVTVLFSQNKEKVAVLNFKFINYSKTSLDDLMKDIAYYINSENVYEVVDKKKLDKALVDLKFDINDNDIEERFLMDLSNNLKAKLIFFGGILKIDKGLVLNMKCFNSVSKKYPINQLIALTKEDQVLNTVKKISKSVTKINIDETVDYPHEIDLSFLENIVNETYDKNDGIDFFIPYSKISFRLKKIQINYQSDIYYDSEKIAFYTRLPTTSGLYYQILKKVSQSDILDIEYQEPIQKILYQDYKNNKNMNWIIKISEKWVCESDIAECRLTLVIIFLWVQL